VEAFVSILTSTTVDLIVSVTRLDTQFVGHLIRDLRLGLLEHPRFPIVLALMHSADADHVRAAINCGVDDLLLMPLSPDTLFKRIGQFTQDRRPFVVTHDYIGPDRRQNPRPGENSAPIIKVPNPVRSRAVGIDDADIASAMNDAAVVIDRYKLKQNGVQLLWLLTRFRGTGEEPPGGTISVPLFVKKSGEVCADIVRRAKGSAERGMRAKATVVVDSIDPMMALGENPGDARLAEFCRAVEDVIDYISAYHGEQLKL
jgi:DNA-binding response OmpR family regulator